jgi:hypothetical protein
MNVMLEKWLRKRFWNRREALDDEVDVVEVTPLDWPTMCAKLCADRETAR